MPLSTARSRQATTGKRNKYTIKSCGKVAPIRDFATIRYAFKYITAEEFLILLDEYQSSNPGFSYHEYAP